MIILLANFEEILRRGDYKKPTWFALPVDILTRSEHFGRINSDMLKVYIYLCGECTKLKSETLKINFIHSLAITNLSLKAFEECIKNLSNIALIGIGSDQEQITNGSDQKTCATLHNITIHNTTAPVRERTYLPLEEETPRKKKEKKQKVELPCEAAEELQGIKSILEERKVSTLLQRKWLKLYPAISIQKAIIKAEAWAISKGREQKNWGLFFNNWLSRNDERGTPAGAASRNHFESQPKEPAKRELSLFEKLELLEKQKREENRENPN